MSHGLDRGGPLRGGGAVVRGGGGGVPDLLRAAAVGGGALGAHGHALQGDYSIYDPTNITLMNFMNYYLSKDEIVSELLRKTAAAQAQQAATQNAVSLPPPPPGAMATAAQGRKFI